LAFRELFPLSDQDTVVDIGSGDGVVLREAARLGARAIGFEINPILVGISRLLSRNTNIRIEMANFWYRSFPKETTLVYIFGVSRDNQRVIQKLQREANRLKRPVHLMTYGPYLTELSPVKKHRGHHLYVFHPLQPKKA
jgi:SAM-dependent methyltransferase